MSKKLSGSNLTSLLTMTALTTALTTFMVTNPFLAKAAFAADGDPTEVADPVIAEQLKQVQNKLAEANQDLSCQQTSDCLTVAVGARACGGPGSFMVASNLNPRWTEVLDLAKQTRQLQAEQNAKGPALSICTIVLPPQVQCGKPLSQPEATNTICQPAPRDLY